MLDAAPLCPCQQGAAPADSISHTARRQPAGNYFTYDSASSAATLVADAYLLLILSAYRDPRAAGASAYNLDGRIPTVLGYAPVEQPAAKLQTAGFGRDQGHLAAPSRYLDTKTYN